MPAMPEMGPAHNEVEADFTDCRLTGDFLNAQAQDHEMLLTFKNCQLTGGISTGSVAHTQGEPREDAWWLIGTVEGTFEPVEQDKGTKVTLDKTSEWTVTKTGYLSGLTLEEGARLSAPENRTLTLYVDGKETPIAPGTYTGKLVLSVD